MLRKKTSLKAKDSTLRGYSTLKNSGKGLKTQHDPLKQTKLNKQNNEAKRKWEEVRQKVLERDNRKCQLCGQPGTQVHHIHLRSRRKDLLYVMNNLITLCDRCHAHQGPENYMQLTEKIAHSKNMTVEELLKFAETKEEG